MNPFRSSEPRRVTLGDIAKAVNLLPLAPSDVLVKTNRGLCVFTSGPAGTGGQFVDLSAWMIRNSTTPRMRFDRCSTPGTMSAACPMSAPPFLKPTTGDLALTGCSVASYISDNLRTSATRFEENSPIPCPHSSRFNPAQNARKLLSCNQLQ